MNVLGYLQVPPPLSHERFGIPPGIPHLCHERFGIPRGTPSALCHERFGIPPGIPPLCHERFGYLQVSLTSVRGCSARGRVQGTRLPAGLSLTSCLPGLCFTSSLPGSFLQRRRPPASRASPARPAAMRNRARQTRALLRSGTSYRSEKNPPLTHGDPAEAGPPGQSQPSRVHPVKQRAGAMRTRTGAHTSSSSCARPAAWICAYLPTRPGGGRHPQTRPTSPPPCGIPREKPPRWPTATSPRIPPLPPAACRPSAPRFNSLSDAIEPAGRRAGGPDHIPRTVEGSRLATGGRGPEMPSPNLT
jgi:hypothetical protein